MDKKRFFDFLYIFLILAVIGFMLFAVVFMKSNAKQCLENPIDYFQEKNDAYCSCYDDTGFYNEVYMGIPDETENSMP